MLASCALIPACGGDASNGPGTPPARDAAADPDQGSPADAARDHGGDAAADLGGDVGADGAADLGSDAGTDSGAPAPVTLAFSTLIGVAGWERVQSVFVDATGAIFACGSTQSSGFPTTTGAYDRTYGGTSNDGWVAKFSADGSQLLWSTYLGGSERDDCYGIRVDPWGAVILTGWTRSTDFPTTAGAYDRTPGGLMDIFVAKLSADGSQLLYSTLIGGTGTDQCRGAMDLDATGRVWLAGYTDSTDIPVSAGAIQSTFQGGYGDAYVARLSADGSALEYGTYLGSSGPDNAFAGITLNTDDSVSLVGLAGAADFPITPGFYQDTFGGGSGTGPWYGDAFVARFTVQPAGSTDVHFITFLGGSGDDQPMGQHAMAADAGGILVFATTNSASLPTTAGAYQSTLVGTDSLYLARLSYAGGSLVAATYLGGPVSSGGGYEPSGIRVAPGGEVYVGGSIFGDASGVHPVTGDAAQPAAGGLGEGFFSILSADLGDLIYSTYVGGSADDRVRDLWLAPGAAALVVGDTSSTDFSTTPGAYQTTHGGDADGHLALYAR